ncbi:FAD-binding protein [Microbacterium sp. UFMG61]|uniref:FAD-binding protein n=1 Tax=Microbacterium sp. UFMG61 TaxID=2745935 RepID=UPI00188F5EF0|nr:FAD-binding protein [Microbacterium sp. UFMG61]
MNERTWSGTHTFRASKIVYPRSTAEAAQLLRSEQAEGRRVRGLGTRHSFNDIADNDGTLISLIDIPASPELVDSGDAVKVAAGTRYGELATWLEAHGRALRNMGSLPHISIAGAISTGTHGSGDENGILATSVRRITWLDADGEERSIARGDESFAGMLVGLGAYGLITEVVLDIEPTYLVRQDVYRGISWDTLLFSLNDITASAHSVSIFTMWDEPTVEQVWVKKRVAADDHTDEEWFGGQRERVPAALVGSSENLTEHGIAGPWLDRIPHFRVDSAPSHGDEIQTEYFVSRPDAAAAVAAVRELGAQLAPLLHVSELRTVAADEIWLSPAYKQAVLGIHFTWRNDLAGVHAVLPAVESALAPYRPRPHWGKVHLIPADGVTAAWDRLPEARALYEALDPSGSFSNDYLERLGLRGTR